MAPVCGLIWIDMFSTKAFWMGSKRREVWTVKVRRASRLGGMVSSSASDGVVDEGVCSGLRGISYLGWIFKAPSAEGTVGSAEAMVLAEALGSWSWSWR